MVYIVGTMSFYSVSYIFKGKFLIILHQNSVLFSNNDVIETFHETFEKSRRDSRLKKSLEVSGLESHRKP